MCSQADFDHLKAINRYQFAELNFSVGFARLPYFTTTA
jgi:hypothetical protein